jgi:hypothetical protein
MTDMTRSRPITMLLSALSAVLILSSACSRPTPTPVVDRDSIEHQDMSRSAVRARLALRRAQQLDQLGAYAVRGEFPHNYAQPMAAHVFRDAAGRLCAVANLVHQDGRDDLVDATVREHNDLAVADVHDGPMLDWILGSGLTQEELARIQLPAPPLAPQFLAPAIARPAPIQVQPLPSDEAKMNVAVVQHIDQVRRELRANVDKSLDLATERYIASSSSPAPKARPRIPTT